MSAALLLAVYAVGWFVAAVTAMRHFADNWGHCHGRGVDRSRLMDGRTAGLRSSCRGWHGPTCWRGDGEVGVSQAAAGVGVALAWPALILPAAAWFVATRKPTPIGREREIERLRAEIARMDRELGIGS